MVVVVAAVMVVSVCVYVCVCMHMYSHMHVHTLAHGNVCVHGCGDQRLMIGVFLHCCPLYFLRQGLSLNLGLAN